MNYHNLKTDPPIKYMSAESISILWEYIKRYISENIHTLKADASLEGSPNIADQADNQIATTLYVIQALNKALGDFKVMQYKGLIVSQEDLESADKSVGSTYIASTEFKYTYTEGSITRTKDISPGDMFIRNSSGWDVITSGTSNKVSSDGDSFTIGNIPIYNSDSGIAIKDSGISASTLVNTLNNEILERASSISELKTTINNDVNTKINTLSSTIDNNIKTSIEEIYKKDGETESGLLINKASALASSILAESERATSSETELSSNISSVAKQLDDFLGTEEGSINDLLTTLDNKLSSNITSVSSNLSSNYYTKTNIDSKVSTIESSISSNASSIESEVTRATDSESTIASALAELDTSVTKTVDLPVQKVSALDMQNPKANVLYLLTTDDTVWTWSTTENNYIQLGAKDEELRSDVSSLITRVGTFDSTINGSTIPKLISSVGTSEGELVEATTSSLSIYIRTLLAYEAWTRKNEDNKLGDKLDNSLLKYVKIEDIVNGLESSSTDKPLSAAAGASLSRNLTSIKEEVDNEISGLGSVFTFKGSVNAYSDFPSSGNNTGDVYQVLNDTGAETVSEETNAFYAFTDSGEWTKIYVALSDVSSYFSTSSDAQNIIDKYNS